MKSKIKYLLISFILMLNSSVFCQIDTLNRERITEIFKEINKSDASYLKEPDIRNAICIKNFNNIIGIIKNQGHPKFTQKKENKKLNESIDRATSRTFIHILQTKPELLLNKETIAILKREIKQDRLTPDLLKLVLQTFQYDIDKGNNELWNVQLRDNFYLAIKEWDIKLYSSDKN